MKKILSFLLVIILTLGVFTSCFGGDNEVSSDTAADVSTTADETKEDVEVEVESEAVEISAEVLFKNVNARKAITYAIDKIYITDAILSDGSLPVDFFVPKNLAVDESGADFRTKYPDGWNHYDIDKAKEHWELAKEELGFDTATFELLLADNKSNKKIGEFIQGQLSTNLDGLSVILNQQPFKNQLALAEAGDFDAEIIGWMPDYPDPMTYLDLFVSDSYMNTIGFKNEKYDEYIERTKYGDLTEDQEARWELLQETERYIIEDEAILVPIYQAGVSRLEQPYVTGVQTHTFGGEYTYKYADTTFETDGQKIIRRLAGSDIPTMDTNKSTDVISGEILTNVLEGLFMLGENDTVEEGVATSYEVSEDGLTYTFHLREDAMWSNGDPVTAHDFVYSWRRLADPNTGSQYAYMIETSGVENGYAVMAGEVGVEELGVEAVDDYTLVAHLEVPVPYFIKLMTFANFFPVNQKFVEKHGDAFGTTVETTLCNGPFKLNQWDIGYQFGFEKNDMYWNSEAVEVDAVTYRVVKDTAAGVNLYETGEVDRAVLGGEFVEQFADHPHFKIEPRTSLTYLEFNIDNTGMDY